MRTDEYREAILRLGAQSGPEGVERAAELAHTTAFDMVTACRMVGEADLLRSEDKKRTLNDNERMTLWRLEAAGA